MIAAQNLDAEESVLGAMMAGQRAILAAQDRGLRPEHFYRKTHGRVCRAVYELDGKGEAVDPLTVHHHLKQAGDDTPLSTLNGLVQNVSAISSAGNHAQIVLDVAAVRSVQTAATRLAELAEGEGSAAEKLSEAERIVADATNVATVEEFTKIGEQMAGAFQEIREAQETGKRRVGLKTGFTKLDSMTSGLFPGQLFIIAASTGMGKSTLGQNIAEYVARKGKKVAIFSLEMGADEIGTRMIASRSGVDHQRIKEGQMDVGEWTRVQAAYKEVSGWSVYTVDDTVNVQELRARTRSLKRREGLDLLIVDYLQLLSVSGKSENRNVEVGEISRTLKLLARELGIPILALSQLNRAWAGRKDARPQLSDLRDSGSIEQDADAVLFIHRDEMHNPESERLGEADLIVAKQRSGATGTIALSFQGKRCRFTNLAQEDEPMPPGVVDTIPF